MTSIYTKPDTQLHKIFQAAPPAKILCAPIDYAKSTHLVMFCNGLGDVLKKPFPVQNNQAGAAFLLEHLHKTLHHRSIDPAHVFFGGEDCPCYAQNFIAHLREKGFPVAQLNAWEVSRQRENFQATTDRLALDAMAKSLLQRRGNFHPAVRGLHRNLRELTRTRRQFVAQITAVGNRIHTYVDRLLPGFLDPKQSGIAPFSQASLHLMAERFSSPQILRRRLSALTTLLQKLGVQQAEQAAQRLRQCAAAALPPPLEHRSAWQRSLSEHVQLYRCLESTCLSLEREMAHLLAQTSGAFLTSISGLGIVLAAGITSELGAPPYRGLDRLCSYAGIIPGTDQTGGPDQPPKQKRTRPRCNRILKDWIVQASNKMKPCGPPELSQLYAQMEANGQHAAFAMAKRLLRLSKQLLSFSHVYLPKPLWLADSAKAERAAYYLQLWPKLLAKWKPLARLQHVFAPANPLGQWRLMVQEAYSIALPLPKERHPELR